MIIFKNILVLSYSFSYPPQFVLVLDLVIVNFYAVFSYSFSFCSLKYYF